MVMIDDKLYRRVLVFYMLLSIPSLLALFLGVSLMAGDTMRYVGYIYSLLGLSGTMFAVCCLFEYFKVVNSTYDWGRHFQTNAHNGLCVVKKLPFLYETIDFNDLKDIRIEKEELNLDVTFVTDKGELKVKFTSESYDILISIKQNYIIGW